MDDTTLPPNGHSAPLRCSVVIPARNAARSLDHCLQALRNGSDDLIAEVIVVDDDSSDDTAELARAAGARVLSLNGLGPAAARNAGIRESVGDVVVFIDADCVAESGFLKAILDPFSDPEVSGVRGRYASDQQSVIARFVQLEMEEKQERLASSSRVAIVDTACAAYRRRVFTQHGGFDESFRSPSVEDADFSFRLTSRGERLVYAPDARVRHRHPESLWRYCWRKLRFGYYRARIYRQYPARLVEDGYTPRLMPLQIALSGVLAAGATLGIWWAPARLVGLTAGVAFVGTTLPLSRRAWSTDRRLSSLVPVLLLARSLAQGVGLACGMAALAISRRDGAGHRTESMHQSTGPDSPGGHWEQRRQ